MDILQLKYFTTIIEEGTISAASRKLHISQPPLSAQMHKLEAELKVQLFLRGSRQIKLTDAGTLLYQYAQEILDMQHNALTEISNLRIGRTGSLRIGLVSSFDSDEFYAGIDLFHQRFPDVNFQVYEGNTYELQDMLKNNKIELALVRTPFLASELEVSSFSFEPMLAVGKPDFFTGLPRMINLSDLVSRPLITYRRRERFIRAEFEKVSFAPNFICINDDARTSIQWAQAGLGIALVPSCLSFHPATMEMHPLAEENLGSTLALIHKKGALLSQSALSLFQIFASRFNQNLN